MTAVHEELLRELQNFSKTAFAATSLMERISQRLHEKLTRYNWVGFYLIDCDDPNVLVIGPFVGSFTPNRRIPLSTGLCGAAARTGKTVVVDDVAKDPRYLPGSSLVHSEMVVPIFVKDRLVGEFDVESYFPNTFTTTEQKFVQACADVVGKYMARG
jgi:L-methionine (R)-S-oxide reductase